jgi:hypothetical protein
VATNLAPAAAALIALVRARSAKTVITPSSAVYAAPTAPQLAWISGPTGGTGAAATKLADTVSQCAASTCNPSLLTRSVSTTSTI